MLEHFSGATRIYFIVGDPIAQVKSPYGVTQALQARGQDAIMVPVQVRSADLPAFFALTERMPNVDGLCITVPHKFAAAALCNTLSPAARSIGAANVAKRNAQGHWHGHMCDGEGYVAGLRQAGCEPRGQRALLVGAGGAGSAIAHALVDAGVRELAVYDSDAARCALLISKLKAYGSVMLHEGSTDPTGYDITLNATPMGMKANDALPIQADRLSANTFVGCVVTQPAVPPLIEAARAKGCGTMTGAGMFEAVRERMVAFYLGAG